MPHPAKPLRRDAQRNRDQLVQAARQLFAVHGLGVALDEIARAAGVSIGTLYNHFPNRADLVDAVFADRAETVVRFAEHALSIPDPWAGFVHFLERVCELQAADRGYNDLVSRRLPQATPTEGHLRGYELMKQIVERARQGRAAGRLHPGGHGVRDLGHRTHGRGDRGRPARGVAAPPRHDARRDARLGSPSAARTAHAARGVGPCHGSGLRVRSTCCRLCRRSAR